MRRARPSELLHKLFVQGLKIVKGGLLRGPANDKTLGVAGRRLGDDVEVDVIDLLMRDLAVILHI